MWRKTRCRRKNFLSIRTQRISHVVRAFSLSSHLLTLSSLIVLHLSTTHVPPTHGLDNLALGKPAAQNSVWSERGSSPAYAHLANDGDTNSIFNQGSCSKTGSPDERDGSSWWIVDLLHQYLIHSVKITNRKFTDVNKLKNFSVYVSAGNPREDGEFPAVSHLGELCVFRTSGIKSARTEQLSCGESVGGRYLTIHKIGNSNLVLCEVQVFGELILTLSSSSSPSTSTTAPAPSSPSSSLSSSPPSESGAASPSSSSPP
ncbi:fucolectin-4, partial [Aplysia californica]|uniref:Fucolectin-4 n=1 Tax=Aplysia californica TaxID=6500 RepID=A0ABM0ZYB5_APLCA